MGSEAGVRVSLNMIYDYITKNMDTIEDMASGIIRIKTKKEEPIALNPKDSELSDKEPTLLTLGEVKKLRYLPSYLKSFFNNQTFLHMGVLSKLDDDNTEQEISFFSSILSCLNQTFNDMDSSDKKKYIKKIFDSLKRDIILEGFSSFGYGRMKWDKKEVHRDLDNFRTTKQTIRYFIDYLHINVFILDIENDSIIFTGGDYIPYKKTIFVMRYENNHYEPLFTEKSKVSSYADQLVQKVIIDYEYIQTFNVDFRKDSKQQSFSVKDDDYSKYINLETIKFNEPEKKDNDAKSTSSDNITNKFDDTDSSDTDMKTKVIGRKFYIRDISSSESSDEELSEVLQIEKMNMKELKVFAEKHDVNTKEFKTKSALYQEVQNVLKKKK